MATATVLKRVLEPFAFISEHKEFGRPLFTQLVPFVAHEIASIYRERRDRLVNSNIISELEILTNKIYDTLNSLNLPKALLALRKPIRLPSTLLLNIKEVRQGLQRSFTNIAKLKCSNEAIFSKGKEILQLRCRAERRIAKAKELYTQVIEIEGYLRDAANCDTSVKRKY
jgi:programmed cell death 6-interacting protein